MTVLEQTKTPVGTWELDPAHSNAGFIVKHMLVSTMRGRFNEFDLTLKVDDDGYVSIEGEADATSVDTFSDQLNGHLQSPDFFDTSRYPAINFKSTEKVKFSDSFKIQGEITIKGTTRPIEIEATFGGLVEDPYGNQRIGLELHTDIDRTQFDVNWNAPMPGGGLLVSENVHLEAHMELTLA